MAFNTTASASANATAVLPDCLILQFDDFVPWSNPDNIISSQTEDLVRRLKNVVFLPIFFLIGAPANVINMVVFYKQGLKERINVCLFALSFSDGLYLACNMVWHGEQLHLQFTTKEMYGPVMGWLTKYYIMGLYGLAWVSQVISAIIASERCFCILQPLRSHSILKTSTITVVIVVVFLVVIGVYCLVITRYSIVCAYDPVSKSVITTLIGREFYYRHQKLIDFLDVIIYGAGLPGVVIVVMVITTIVTTVKLRQAAEWRAQISSRGGGVGGGGGSGGGGGVSAQEIALTMMLVYNSIFFIICAFPNALFRLAQLGMPELNAGRRHHNLFIASLWLLDISSYINSTFNIIIYYTMGSRYRQMLRSLFLGRLTISRASDMETTMPSK